MNLIKLLAIFLFSGSLTIGYGAVNSATAKNNELAFSSKALSGPELQKLVSGNTMIGTTCHTNTPYLLYFFPDGRLYFEKNNSDNKSYIGKWSIEGHNITSQWPNYKRTGKNILTYHHVTGNVYTPFNVNNACGPAGTYGRPFMVLQGAYTLKKLSGPSEFQMCKDSDIC
jgi:hypothetical protein